MGENRGPAELPAVPRFGAVLDRMESFARYGLDTEMYHLRRNHCGSCQEVRMLHASTKLSGARPEVGKIIEYMNGEGFVVEGKLRGGRKYRPEWLTADMLLLGCDSKRATRASNAMDEMERGLHGLLREWDVLWYFSDGGTPHDRRASIGEGSLCCNDGFSDDGIRMAHAHIRRRCDITARRGLYITLEQWISDGIDRIVPPKTNWDTFGKKVDRLKRDIGAGGRDRELFFAVVEFLMEVRNRSSHPRVSSSFVRRMASYNHLEHVADRHGFDLHQFDNHGCPRSQDNEPSPQDWHAAQRACIVLTHMAGAWLGEYYDALPEDVRRGGATLTGQRSGSLLGRIKPRVKQPQEEHTEP